MFISLEGTEGVGKSTLIQGLQDYFSQNGKEVIITREPGGTPLAEDIRKLLVHTHQEKMDNHCELLLIYAARSQHIAQVILPALQHGKVVLSDRFVDASFAYQCAGRGVDLEKISALNEQFVSILPDLTFWLDAPIELGLQRALQRGQLDRFEQEKYDFFAKVHAGYQELYENYPERIKRLDATQQAEQVLQQALTYL
ncbi:dTMP kinase [Moraxella sp. ZY210820]|uniref:dTMP kinase n=1 Tax=unclassified Moraxella TaxID=2685852 RepID=UPI00272F0F33|nr:dTMP kinase [Moraxella sp. ZY210820]WLF83159.1 dTMP kinase [Moraxella sp. ZY210820]